MELACTYIETDKFDEVVSFYEKVFNKKSNVYTENRWVEFDFGNKLSIYNKNYDNSLINNDMNNYHYNDAYKNNYNSSNTIPCNNIVIFNFYCDDLNYEYKRIKSLNICDVSEIMYVNITEPYYYFNIYDPAGNTIEICGKYIEQ